MPNANLYLHEVIHIVGTGSEAYKRHTGERAARRGGTLVGTWQQSGSTGDWPCVVNLWEMAGWEGWADTLDYQYAQERQPSGLRGWWTTATRWRSGGFDRILEPASFCPTRRELIERGVRGRACIQEIVTVRPGAAEEYLDAVAHHWLPVAARRGLTLVGAWRTAMRDTEAVLLWCLPTVHDFTRHLADFWSAPETRAWAALVRTWRTDYRETLLVPSVWCVVHPAWRERPARAGAGAPQAPRHRRKGSRRPVRARATRTRRQR
jgi:hypothetical protein